ncbi:MAG: lysophospholipid acyltransferase family protein, partial [Planctomycetota bacterium]
SFLGEWIGILAFHLGTEERNRALRHLRWAFEDTYSRGKRRSIAFDAFRNFGRAMAEAFAGTKLSTPELETHVENAKETSSRLRNILQEGAGMIALTGHLGNWELLGNFSARYFPVSCVAHRLHFEPFNRLSEDVRHAGNIGVIYLHESPREIVRTLKRNEVVAILTDQDIRRLPGTYVRFFGRPAWTPIGPVLTAKLSGAPIFPIFMFRRGNKYRIELGKRIPMVFTGDRRRDLYENTQKMADVYEEYIRRHPDQWAWNHQRWKTKPSNVPPAFRRFATFPAELKNGGPPARRREPENSA